MKVEINRTQRKIQLPSGKDIFVGSILEQHEYKPVNVLDIENHTEIKWQGIEFNGLYTKDGILYRFNEWVGEYPYKAIEIEEIGKLQGAKYVGSKIIYR